MDIVGQLDAEKMKQGFSTVCFPEGPVYVLYGDWAKKFERLHQQNAELVEALIDMRNHINARDWDENVSDETKATFDEATGGE